MHIVYARQLNGPITIGSNKHRTSWNAKESNIGKFDVLG